MVENDHTHGTGRHYVPGCPDCMVLNRAARARGKSTPEGREKERARDRRYNRSAQRMEYMRNWMTAYRATTEGRIIQNSSALKSQAARREQLRLRSTEEQDEDFLRLHPTGLKECRGCHKSLPRDAFPRNRSVSSGRGQSCTPCATKRSQRKYRERFEASCRARGVDPLTCFYCEAELTEESREFDHFFPLARGGEDRFENLVPACVRCNRGVGGKRDADPWEWLLAKFPARIPSASAIFQEAK